MEDADLLKKVEDPVVEIEAPPEEGAVQPAEEPAPAAPILKPKRKCPKCGHRKKKVPEVPATQEAVAEAEVAAPPTNPAPVPPVPDNITTIVAINPTPGKRIEKDALLADLLKFMVQHRKRIHAFCQKFGYTPGDIINLVKGMKANG